MTATTTRVPTLHHSCSRHGFTLVELLVVLGIVGALMGLCVAYFQGAAAKRHQAACQSNLRQIGQAVAMYTADYDGSFPPLRRLAVQVGGINYLQVLTLSPKGKLTNDLKCPSAEAKDPLFTDPHQIHKRDLSGYAMNANLNEKRSMDDRLQRRGSWVGIHDSVVASPALTVLVCDARTGLNGLYHPDTEENRKKYDDDAAFGIYDFDVVPEIWHNVPGAVRHGGAGEYVFADGHVSHLRPEQIDISGSKTGTMPRFDP